MRNELRILITLTVISFAVPALVEVYASSIATPSIQAGGTGLLPVAHHPVLDARVVMTGGGSLTSSNVDYVQVTAYVLDPSDAGYYNITVIVYFADQGTTYAASGVIYLGTTPTNLYFSIPPTYQGSDTRVYAFAAWLG